MRKFQYGLFLLFLAQMFFLGGALGWAAQVKEGPHRVTFEVPGILSIRAFTSDFTLTFNDFEKGVESTVQLVRYRVQATGMTQAALNDVISAQISSLVYGVDLKADMGRMRFIGSSVVLQEETAGYTAVGTAPTTLAGKPATPGRRLLNGLLDIYWRGTATEDLTAGTYSTDLIVTLKNA